MRGTIPYHYRANKDIEFYLAVLEGLRQLYLEEELVKRHTTFERGFAKTGVGCSWMRKEIMHRGAGRPCR
jgi:hypothetical protein